MMDKSSAKSPYEQIWEWTGVVDIALIGTFLVGKSMLIGGFILSSRYSTYAGRIEELTGIITKQNQIIENADSTIRSMVDNANKLGREVTEQELTMINKLGKDQVNAANVKFDARSELSSLQRMGTAARWLMGIGGALMIAAAITKGIQLWKYYNRTFLPIPLYIVDEADIVSYTTDKNGNEVKNIDFDQYVYYEVVKCNRQDIGVNSKAQDGVDQYAEWGCGDAADLNCDIGKQWLALYTVKSDKKGDPILADSLKLQTGSDAVPAGCTVPLHFFTYTYAADLGDEAYAYGNDMNGVYFFWDTDANAYTASSFTTGQLALAGIGGLAAGILGASVVMLITKKRKDVPETPAVA
ncbi:MAG: hypothetical protein IJ906_15825, partial [Oscillospiraceae bacterium]|nr:hypothetical protein [Oscillospiraceae bacterium]